MTLEPSQPTFFDGMELPSMSSPAGSRAKMSVSPVRAVGLMVNAAGYGERLPASLANFDLTSSSWKTSQLCLGGGLAEFSETWPRSGMMRSGIAYPLDDLAPRTKGIAFGLLPSPTVGGGGQTLPEGTTPTGQTPEGRKQTVCLERYLHQVANGIWPIPFLPTITVNDAGNITAPKSQFIRDTPGLPVRLAMTAGIRLGHGSLRTFAEWMMGYGVGWTRPDLPLSETQLRRPSPN
jgi:hypothetical protein